MSGQNRILAILLGALAVLVLVVGGLSAFLLLSDDGDGAASGGGSGSTIIPRMVITTAASTMSEWRITAPATPSSTDVEPRCCVPAAIV